MQETQPFGRKPERFHIADEQVHPELFLDGPDLMREGGLCDVQLYRRRLQRAFNALPALASGDIDVVISSDPETIANVEFHDLFSYAPTFIASRANPLAGKSFVEATDFADQTLITYPVERSRLDIFSQILMPARVEPKTVRQIELTAVILLLVDANKGVSALPDWVIDAAEPHRNIVARPITEGGITRILYAATRRSDHDKPFIQRFIELGRARQRPVNGAI